MKYSKNQLTAISNIADVVRITNVLHYGLVEIIYKHTAGNEGAFKVKIQPSALLDKVAKIEYIKHEYRVQFGPAEINNLSSRVMVQEIADFARIARTLNKLELAHVRMLNMPMAGSATKYPLSK